MLRLSFLFVVSIFVGSSSSLVAQMPEFPAPEKEHKWLEQFVGEWEIESKGSMGPDQPAMQFNGKMNARMLGGFWVVNELNMDMTGMQMTGIQTIGYNSEKSKYVGTWVDSMMNHLWHYEGTVDESGKKLTLEAEGPDFQTEGKMTQYRDAYEFKSSDHIVATSSMQGEDGEWIVFSTGNMRRVR